MKRRAHTWTFSDGTVVKSGGKVTGDSELAEKLRYDFELSQNIAGGVVYVEIFPQPSGGYPLDVKSDWMIDRWLKNTSYHWRWCDKVTLASDYVPDDARAPTRHGLRARLLAWKNRDPSLDDSGFDSEGRQKVY